MALKRPLPCVHPLVLREGGALHEGLATVPAHIGLLPRVDLFVHGEVPGVAEGLAALAAPARLAPLVDSGECDLLGSGAEASPTAVPAPGPATTAAALMTKLPPLEPGAAPTQAFSRKGFLEEDRAHVETCACLSFGAFALRQLPREGFFLSEHHRFCSHVQGLWGPSLRSVLGGGGGGPGVLPGEFLHFQVEGWFFLRNVGFWS